jgi:hypothetical protein
VEAKGRASAAFRARLAEDGGTGALAGAIGLVALVVAIALPLRAALVEGVPNAFVRVVQLVPERLSASGADAGGDPHVQLAMGRVTKWLRDMAKKPPRFPRPSAEELRLQREIARREISETSERLVRLRQAQRANQEVLDRMPNTLSGLERGVIARRMAERRLEIDRLEAHLQALLRDLPPL